MDNRRYPPIWYMALLLRKIRYLDTILWREQMRQEALRTSSCWPSTSLRYTRSASRLVDRVQTPRFRHFGQPPGIPFFVLSATLLFQTCFGFLLQRHSVSPPHGQGGTSAAPLQGRSTTHAVGGAAGPGRRASGRVGSAQARPSGTPRAGTRCLALRASRVRGGGS